MNEVIEWSDIEAELNKAEQMGYQTVLQFAKVGQMLVAKMGDMTIREFVPRVGQHIPRLSKSTIHRYLMLAEHVHLLEQHKPESQRAALALIQAANRPAPQPAPKPAPAPSPAPKPAPEPAPATDEATEFFNKARHNQAIQLIWYIELGHFLNDLWFKKRHTCEDPFDVACKCECPSEPDREFMEDIAKRRDIDVEDLYFALDLVERFYLLNSRFMQIHVTEVKP